MVIESGLCADIGGVEIDVREEKKYNNEDVCTLRCAIAAMADNLL